MSKSFIDRLLKHADTHGNGIALRFKKNNWEEYSWSQLTEKVNMISAALLNIGVKEQDNIGVFSQNMPEWTLSDLAIMRIQAVTIPIYPTNTAGQAQYLVDETEMKVMFVGEKEQYEKALEIYADSDSTLEKIIVFDNELEINHPAAIKLADFVKNTEVDLDELDNKLNRIKQDDLATIIYTSGTTGEPKGVMITHANLNQAFKIHDIRLKLNSDDHSLAFLPLSHIFERAWSLYTLYRGVKVSYCKDPKDIVATLAEVKPTAMCSVPRLYQKAYHSILAKVATSSSIKKKLFNAALEAGKRMSHYTKDGKKAPLGLSLKHTLLDKIVLKKIRKAFGGNLRFMPTAGAPLSGEMTEFFHALGLNVLIGYGLTETCATVTVFPDKEFEFGTVGVTMPEVEVKIGKNDEILVKGDTVMKGYYKKPKETAKVFTKDGWLRTGDAGTLDEKGSLTITDRIKDLMKTSGGKYVAPQPIESILTNDNFIENAILIGDDKPFVTALVVPNFDVLKDYAHSLNIKFHNLEDLLKKSSIVEFYEEKLNQLQDSLANFEKVKKFKLLPHDFNINLGELTPTLKIRRKIIIQHFSPVIDEMYAFV